MALSIPPSPSAPVCYRFAGVRVDTAARRLWVDEVECRVQPLVFNLLWLLCEQPRQVIPRDVLFQRLWPDGSFPSDESLSQIIFKLRSQLGAHGGAIVTVRQVGLRLDADVIVHLAEPALRPEPLLDAMPAIDRLEHGDSAANDDAAASDGPTGVGQSSPGSPAPAIAVATARRRRWHLAAALAVGALGAVALSLHLWLQQVVDPGFGLRVADLGTWQADSVEGIREALRADARGRRSWAVARMEAVHTGDPDTPVPAMFLATWWGQAGDPRAAAMAKAYQQRLGSRTPAYVHLLGTHLLGASSQGSPVDTSQLDLLLIERPGAQRLLLARAHWHLGEVEPAAALRDLRAMAIDDLSDRAQTTALLDRITLGDTAAVAALVPRMPADTPAAAAAHAHVDGWLALAGGDAAQAHARLVQGIGVAVKADLNDAERRLQLAAAIAAGRQRDFASAREHLGRARALAMQQQRSLQAIQAGVLLLALPDWDAPTREALAAELARQMPPAAIWECLDLRLVHALSAIPGDPCPGVATPNTASLRGLAPLLAAYAAQQQGDPASALVQFEAAVADGVEGGLLAPFVRVLAQRLGRSAAPPAPGLQLFPLPSAQATAWWATPVRR